MKEKKQFMSTVHAEAVSLVVLRDVKKLTSLLSFPVRYALTGSMVFNLNKLSYDAPGDVDVIINAYSRYDELVEFFVNACLFDRSIRPVSGYYTDSFYWKYNDRKINLCLCKDKEWNERNKVHSSEIEGFMVSTQSLIEWKMQYAREKDINHLKELLVTLEDVIALKKAGVDDDTIRKMSKCIYSHTDKPLPF